MDYHDDVEEAQEATANSESAKKDKQDEKLLDIESEPKDTLIGLDIDSSRNGLAHDSNDTENNKSLEEFFGNLILEKNVCDASGQSVDKTEQNNHSEFNKNSEERKLVADIFGDMDNTDFSLTDLSSLTDIQQQQSLNLLASESAALLDEILNDKQPCTNNDWESISGDTFLPPNILKQSLGDAALGIGQKGAMTTNNTDDKVSTYIN